MAKTLRLRLSLKRVRTLCVIAAAVLCVMVAVSSRWRLLATYMTTPGAKGSTEWVVGLEGGAVDVHWAKEVAVSDHSAPIGLNFDADRRWQDEINVAWRPYHIAAQPGFTAGDTHHGFVFPLWLAALPAVIAAGYTQGLVVGLRRGDKRRCAKCGYDRTGLAAEATCPECGEAGFHPPTPPPPPLQHQ